MCSRVEPLSTDTVSQTLEFCLSIIMYIIIISSGQCEWILVLNVMCVYSSHSYIQCPLEPLECPCSISIHPGFHPEKFCWGKSCIQKFFFWRESHKLAFGCLIKVTHGSWVFFVWGKLPDETLPCAPSL